MVTEAPLLETAARLLVRSVHHVEVASRGREDVPRLALVGVAGDEAAGEAMMDEGEQQPVSLIGRRAPGALAHLALEAPDHAAFEERNAIAPGRKRLETAALGAERGDFPKEPPHIAHDEINQPQAVALRGRERAVGPGVEPARARGDALDELEESMCRRVEKAVLLTWRGSYWMPKVRPRRCP